MPIQRGAMRNRTILAAVGLLAAVACADPTGPSPPTDGSFDEFAMLARRAGSNGGDVESHILQHAEGASSPEVYKLSFWVTRGKSRLVRILYAEPESDDDPEDPESDDDAEDPESDDDPEDPESVDNPGDDTFLALYVPADALKNHPDGSPIGDEERVLFTITVDPDRLLVSFEPYGLEFNRKSRPWLYLSYDIARGDYDGDGDVDKADSYIEENHLGLWRRTGESSEPARADFQSQAGADLQSQAGGGSWSPGDATKSIKRNHLASHVAKFSDVAVSW